jgi:chloramphenicol-sensitive protein RarD
MNQPGRYSDAEVKSGVILGLLAYTMWGVFPVYFKWIESVAPTEVLVHRVVWAVPFGALIIMARRQWRDVRAAFVDRTMLFWLALAALSISINWLIYIWAVQNERIFEASLGYYINPLVYVAVGVVMFGERLRRLQIIAVVLASIGVAYLTINGGIFPWVALSLAALFTAYGVIRKQVAIGAMPGLFVETSMLFPLALAWLLFLMAGQQASFVAGGAGLSALLVLGGPITVMPLLLFAIAAKRLSLTTLGFLQFLAPTLQFCTGLYYGEKLSPAHLVCFALIWAAVACFSYDAVRASKKIRAPERPVPSLEYSGTAASRDAAMPIVSKHLFVCFALLRFLDDFFSYVGRRRRIVRELHRELATTRGQCTQVTDVAEHLRQRRIGFHTYASRAGIL